MISLDDLEMVYIGAISVEKGDSMGTWYHIQNANWAGTDVPLRRTERMLTTEANQEEIKALGIKLYEEDDPTFRSHIKLADKLRRLKAKRKAGG